MVRWPTIRRSKIFTSTRSATTSDAIGAGGAPFDRGSQGNHNEHRYDIEGCRGCPENNEVVGVVDRSELESRVSCAAANAGL
jgi:hypothetical protein